MKKQLNFIGWRNKKQLKSSGAYRLISLLGSETSECRMVPGLIREPVLVTDEKNKYNQHEFPNFDWFTMIALSIGDNDWLNA